MATPNKWRICIKAWICVVIFELSGREMKTSFGQQLLVWSLSFAPLGYLLWLTIFGGLGADPAKKLALATGDWTIRFLLFTLLLSTLARLYQPARILIRWRRLFGVWTFVYATLHLFIFIALYLDFDGAVLLRELQKRPYISVGFLAWLLLMPLAITSNNRAMRWLGPRWKQLHKLVYLAVLLGVLHLVWQVRSDWFNAAVYSFFAGLLLLERWGEARFRRSSGLAK